jgi:hypothetical protein
VNWPRSAVWRGRQRGIPWWGRQRGIPPEEAAIGPPEGILAKAERANGRLIRRWLDPGSASCVANERERVGELARGGRSQRLERHVAWQRPSSRRRSSSLLVALSPRRPLSPRTQAAQAKPRFSVVMAGPALGSRWYSAPNRSVARSGEPSAPAAQPEQAREAMTPRPLRGPLKTVELRRLPRSEADPVAVGAGRAVPAPLVGAAPRLGRRALPTADPWRTPAIPPARSDRATAGDSPGQRGRAPEQARRIWQLTLQGARSPRH